MIRRLTLIALLLAAAGAVRAGDPHLLVVGGLGGESYYSELFHRWVGSMAEVATQRLGIPPERVIRLEEDPSRDPENIAGVARKENVIGAIRRLARDAGPGDVVAVILMGHGTSRGETTLFNLPGPDLSAAELAAALDDISQATVAVVVAAPASAPFVEALSAPGRIIITATASAAENQHTRFGGHFVDAFAEDAADGDKDGRVSLLEAFNHASRAVARSYESENILPTEHALLDDDGDRVGSREAATAGGDGALANRVHLAADAAEDATTEAGRQRLALMLQARRLVDRIEALKRDKRLLEADEYLEQLESLLLELAVNQRAYRAHGGS